MGWDTPLGQPRTALTQWRCSHPVEAGLNLDVLALRQSTEVGTSRQSQPLSSRRALTNCVVLTLMTSRRASLEEQDLRGSHRVSGGTATPTVHCPASGCSQLRPAPLFPHSRLSNVSPRVGACASSCYQ